MSSCEQCLLGEPYIRHYCKQYLLLAGLSFAWGVSVRATLVFSLYRDPKHKRKGPGASREHHYGFSDPDELRCTLLMRPFGRKRNGRRERSTWYATRGQVELIVGIILLPV